MNILSKNIRSFREKAGLTQDELAQKLGYKTRSSIAKIESGVYDVPARKITLFAKALNVNPATLMCWDK